MEKEKIEKIIYRCLEVFDKCSTTIQWLATYTKEHPNIIELPKEIKHKISSTQLDLYDIKILLQNTINSLGKIEENE
jgi:hypothetical protein